MREYQFKVIIGDVLGIKVARGYAPLYQLSQISKADIYDATKNPTGTQRDLSPKHARDAYEYIHNEELAYWPEVFLSVRDPSVFRTHIDPNGQVSSIWIDIDKSRDPNKIAISRVDGNHRLHFASGDFKDYPPIKKEVSFCLALDLSLENEIRLFRDINNNQRRMNTSHLDNIETRLNDAATLAIREPYLYIAKRLAEDSDSALSGLVYDGGSKEITKVLPLRTLKSGIGYMFSRPTRLTAIDNIDVQIKLIKNYFSALKQWVPEAWKEPKKILLLRGAAFWGACFLGAEIIDRCLASNKYKANDMLKLLTTGKNWDWSQGGDFQGYSGRSGALKIRDLVVTELPDPGGISLKTLAQQIAKGIE